MARAFRAPFPELICVRHVSLAAVYSHCSASGYDTVVRVAENSIYYGKLEYRVSTSIRPARPVNNPALVWTG